VNSPLHAQAPLTSLGMFDILDIMSISTNISSTMPYREKTAWLSLIAMALTIGPYLIWMSIVPPTKPLPDLPTMSLFAAAVVAQVLLMGGGHLWLRMRSPEEAKSPPDERDHAVSLRSVSVAYYVLIVGMILVGCVMPFNSGGWKLINTAVAVIVLAEVVHYGIVIWGYRRGFA